MKSGKQKNKEGIALIYVMLILVLLMISGQALISSTNGVQKESWNVLNEDSAFWKAQGGLAWTQMLLENVRIPFARKFSVDASDIWIHDIHVDGASEIFSTVSVTNVSAGGIVFASHEYFIESVSSNAYDSVSVGQSAKINSLASYITVLYQTAGVGITPYDDMQGKCYFGQNLWLVNWGGYSTFLDRVRIVGGVQFSSSGAINYNEVELEAMIAGDGNLIFQKGVQTRAPAIDPSVTFNNDVLEEVESLAVSAGTTFAGNTTITLAGNNAICVNNGITTTNQANDAAIYVYGDLDIQGVLDGSLSIGVEGVTTIQSDGIIYASAPVNLDVNDWDVGDKNAINDTFGLISKNRIDVVGDYANNAHINLHGAFMSVNDGIAPVNYNSQIEKREMRVYGSVIAKKLKATESQYNGYGCHWMTDIRFQTGQMAPVGFPSDPYSFYAWRRL